MSEFSTDELLLDGFSLSEGAIVVPTDTDAIPDDSEDEECTLRRLVMAALRQALSERQLDLPLGPSIEPEDPSRLLSLNQLAVQLAVTGLSSDNVEFAAEPWQRVETAPQLLVAAGVDDELRIVQIPGVLTGDEVAAALGSCDPNAKTLQLPIQAFKGGIERLFTLALLVRPSALPRRSLLPSPNEPLLERVLDWCCGELSAAFDALGATLEPVDARAFRQAPDSDRGLPEGPLAIVSIPLGLEPSGEICTGAEALRCIERFRLLLIPSNGNREDGAPMPNQLNLRLEADPVGDLLPDGVQLSVQQGGRYQSMVTTTNTALELQLAANVAPILITITPPAGKPLELPGIQLQPTGTKSN